MDSVSAADSIIDGLEMAAHHTEQWKEHEVEKARNENAKPPPINPMMLGLGANAYVLRSVQSVKPADLESALLMLPFNDALRLITYLSKWLDDGAAQIELTCRVAVLLLRLHHSQLVSTPSARPMLQQLRRRLRTGVQGLKNTLGFNLAALTHLQRLNLEKSNVTDPDNYFGSGATKKKLMSQMKSD
eukprot:gene3606-13690_t